MKPVDTPIKRTAKQLEELHAVAAERFPLDLDVDLSALAELADRIEGLAGGDDVTFTGGVVQTLRWLATGATDSESLAVILTAVDAE